MSAAKHLARAEDESLPLDQRLQALWQSLCDVHEDVMADLSARLTGSHDESYVEHDRWPAFLAFSNSMDELLTEGEQTWGAK